MKTFLRAPFRKGRPNDLSWNTRVKGAECPLSPGARGFAHPVPIGVTPLFLFEFQTEDMFIFIFDANTVPPETGNFSIMIKAKS